MLERLMVISDWIIPVLVLFILTYGMIKKIKIYDAFTDGAMEGIKTVIKIFPFLLAMLVAINIFRASGALDLFINLFKPLAAYFDIPENVLPLMFLRPLSGSGSLTYTDQMLKEFGPDSFSGKLASTIQGSTETTFYIITVYFGAIGIKKYRHAVTVGLLADLAGFFAAVFICKLLFL